MRPLALKTILVATDLSEAASYALRTAAHLASLTNGQVHVVHAGDEVHAGKKGGTAREEPVLRQWSDIAIARDVPVEVVVRAGPPGAIVGQESLRVGADVVLLGPHRGGVGGTLGGTADRVVRSSSIPCLILPEELRLPLHRVLVPVDSSAGARGALAVALTWASALRHREKHRTCVRALHVSPESEAGRNAEHELGRVVDEVRQELSYIAGVDVESVLVHGESAGPTILEYADQNRIDLIVIATRGASMTSPAILGSVSSAVARNTRVPVLLVPPLDA